MEDNRLYCFEFSFSNSFINNRQDNRDCFERCLFLSFPKSVSLVKQTVAMATLLKSCFLPTTSIQWTCCTKPRPTALFNAPLNPSTPPRASLCLAKRRRPHAKISLRARAATLPARRRATCFLSPQPLAPFSTPFPPMPRRPRRISLSIAIQSLPRPPLPPSPRPFKIR